MRTLLVGCGAIGGVVGATLLRAGCDLTLVAGNPEFREAIARDGLGVKDLNGQKWHARPARPPVVQAGELQGQAPFDLCLLATKTTTLEEAAREVKPLLASSAIVVCLQNGLPEERVTAVLPTHRVVGCVVGWGATLIGPGLSQRTSRGGLQIGRLGGGGDEDPLLKEVAALLGMGFPTRFVADLRAVRWSKLAINCATSTLGACGGDALGRLLQHRLVRRLTLELWSEISAVARAEGVRMAKVAGTLDIDRLAISEADRRQRLGSPALFYKHSLLWAIGLKFRRMRSSMLIAIDRGRRPEIDWLNGEVVRRGAAHGIKTPVNAALVSLVHDIVARRETSSFETLRTLYTRLAEKPFFGEGPPSAPPRAIAPAEKPAAHLQA